MATKKPTFRLGERVVLKGDKHAKPWIVSGFPDHGTTIVIRREGRTPSIYTICFADPAELQRIKDTP